MTAVDVIQRLHHHRRWVNQNLLDAAENLTEEQLHRPLPIGQGSFWKSLVHLHAAEFVWLEALLGNDHALFPGDVSGQIPGNQLGEGGITHLNDLGRSWRGLEQRWSHYLEHLSAEALDEIVYKTSSNSSWGRFATIRRDVLIHVCTHAHYTAAQMVNMLRQLGMTELPETMLVTLARREMSDDRVHP